MRLLEEKNIHRLFEISLIIKGFFALLEIIGGLVIFFISHQWLICTIYQLTQTEYVGNARNFMAHHLWHWAQNFSISAKHFAAFYLLSHGVVKMWLIIGLWRKKRGYYPIALFVFGWFIIYQLYRFTFTHSILLIFLTILDLVVIVLTWQEYRYLKVTGK
ncbi:DUF2127 domain-containing protein [Candidatus Protochlamydia phocaeensis]|uniref:DUF2127 domain-containing protein n=1 Tax=Candidatus Protochlamydia phocaeensis TaxID=1414722 RepID=UPI0008395E92|nr:DUF2127 domain-containing protein [Candidatus Protochlamydia phocaeensis]